MSGPRGINLALDLARMPALAQSIDKPPLPADIFEVMRIAAASPEVCHSAARATGNRAVLIESRFYLQQVCYDLMRIHTAFLACHQALRANWRGAICDVSCNGCIRMNKDLDSVYTERVLKAWREVSVSSDPAPASNSHAHGLAGKGMPVNFGPRLRMPWIEKPRKRCT
jgi:hypothetical protein